MKVVTFYSYKGGVGRTLALANVGRLMARAGDRVLLVDFDLEAPGLSILPLHGKQRAGAADVDTTRKGVVDFVEAALANAQINAFDYCHRIPGEPNLFLMPAGALSDRYTERLADLKFATFYQEDGAAKLRALFQDLAQRHGLGYVLVDSRTGYSDYGWLCLVDLADIPVIVASLNRQNLQGASAVANMVRERTNRGAGDRLVLAASLVPEGEEDLKERRFRAAEGLFGMPFSVTIPYNSRVSLIEDLAFLNWKHSSLAAAYRRLVREIRNRNPEDRLSLKERARAALEKADFSDLALFERAAEANDTDPAVRSYLAVALSTAGRHRESIRAFRRAAELSDEDPLGRLTHLTAAMGSRRQLLSEASRPTPSESPREATSPPDSVEGPRRAPSASPELGRPSLREILQSAIDESRDDIAAARSAAVADLDRLAAWGYAVLGLARLARDLGAASEAAPLWSEACDCLARVALLRPDDVEALGALGYALSAYAHLMQGADADALFARAAEQYARALAIKPDMHWALTNWGLALGNQARLKRGAERDALLRAATDRFLAVERLDPGREAYNLACASALLADEAACRDWLGKAREHRTLPPRSFMAGDTDLDSVRATDWFQEILAAAPE